MNNSPYKFDLIKSENGIKIYYINFRGQKVGTIETAQNGNKKISLYNGYNWEGSFCGDMWDFLFSKEPYKK